MAIIHKDVKSAECPDGFFDCGFDGAGIGGIGLNCDRLPAVAVDLLDD
jgi:hypothetical protein